MTEPYALSRLLLRLPAGPRAATVAALYAAFGAVWIAVGDALVFEATSSRGVLGALQAGKGMLFVCLTTALVYLAARRFFYALERRARAERQRAEELRALLAALPDLAFRLDGAGRVVEHLPTAGPQPAFPPEAFIGRSVVDFLPQHVAASVQVAVDAALQGPQPTEVAYALEVAEQLRHYEARIRPLGEGTCGALVLIRDTTRQRQAEAQRELADLVFQHSTNGLVITAEDGEILAVNPAFEAITGYRAAEIVGKTPAVLRSGRHDEAFYAAMWASLRAHGAWRGELWNRRASGELYPEFLEIQAIPPRPGQRARYIGFFSDLSDARAAEAEIERLNHEDTVTGLPNRRLITSLLDRAARAARAEGHHGVVASIDLEGFRRLNEAHGLDYGDALLREMAVRLVAASGPEDLIARVGADEFLVVRERGCDLQAAGRFASELQRAIEAPFSLDALVLTPRAAIGLARIDPEGADGAGGVELLVNAEAARRQAQQRGGREPEFYRSEITANVRRELALDGDLRRAIAGDELELHYQPIVDVASGVACGVEALVRWRRADGTLVPPDAFIPRAEQSGQIGALGRWVLREACAFAARQRRAGGPVRLVAVNVSPRQFADAGLAAEIEAELGASGLPPEQLELEITESALMHDPEAAAAQLGRLAALGVRVAVDDFGTGYSSLATLRRFPVHKLKIDRAFIAGLPGDATNGAICRAVVELARAFGLTVHAEGVETAAQLEALRALGCDCYQGWLFAPALPEGELAARLTRPSDAAAPS